MLGSPVYGQPKNLLRGSHHLGDLDPRYCNLSSPSSPRSCLKGSMTGDEGKDGIRSALMATSGGIVIAQVSDNHRFNVFGVINWLTVKTPISHPSLRDASRIGRVASRSTQRPTKSHAQMPFPIQSACNRYCSNLGFECARSGVFEQKAVSTVRNPHQGGLPPSPAKALEDKIKLNQSLASRRFTD